jgi:tRNA(Leu) C34 or U34 (ribose-2'-O)-methylase TrmL
MRGYSVIGLMQPKDKYNIGSVLRAAQVYQSSMVVTQGERYSKAGTDTMKAHRHLPLVNVDDLFSVIPFDCVPVAVDLVEGAIPLPEYKHPRSAFYIFGAEDGTLGKATTDRCRDVVYIPTNGCMNLACCVNVVLYDRLAKTPQLSTEKGDSE